MLATNAKLPQFIDGIGRIAHIYQGYILDLWGVVHDGIKPFPDTLETLSELRRAKRKVWMLSNAPRRAWVVQRRLTEMGIPEHLYEGVVTSGEATWEALRDTYLEKWGPRCFHLGQQEKDASLYEDLDVRVVAGPEEADFVLNSGVTDFSDTAEQYIPVLQACFDRGLPMICANPDRIVHVEEQLVVCAGALADMYEQMGGGVTYFGKPHRRVYSMCLEAMEAKDVLAVGDAMQTDIAGATAVGLDSILVTSGIHRGDLGENGNEALLQQLLSRYPYRPSYLMTRLYW